MKSFKKYLSYLLTGFWGAIFPLFRSVDLLRSRFWWTCYYTIICRLKGIGIGKKVLFYGKTYFFKEPGSSIIINDRCLFNSNFKYNLLGINRSCIVSTLSTEAKIIIGKNCAFSGATISAHKYIEIGRDLKCGANVVIIDSDWHPEDYRSGNDSPVLIGNNVWLGMNTVILKGVTIGDNALIGANSVVTRDIPANVIAAGNPCKIIKVIDNKSVNS